MDTALRRRPEATLFLCKTKGIAHSLRGACYTFRKALLDEIRQRRRQELEASDGKQANLFDEVGEENSYFNPQEFAIDLELEKLTTPYHDLFLQIVEKEKDGKTQHYLRMSFENPRAKDAVVAVLDEEGNELENP
jgi:hypothetical protein